MYNEYDHTYVLGTGILSYEELQELEYADEENVIDIRYPETYC